MKKHYRRATASIAGISALFSQGAVAEGTQEPQIVHEQEIAVDISAGENVVYNKAANITGTSITSRMCLPPNDQVFCLFGTAATAVCARPGFAFDQVKTEDYYINVSGSFEKTASITLAELEEKGQSKIMSCSCGMSPSVANAEGVGMYLKDVVEMMDLTDEINTVTVQGSDGYGKPIALKTAIDKGAMLVYAVGGEGLTPENGGLVQLWIPGSVAQYFTRQVTDIIFTAEENEPEELQPQAEQRVKVGIVNEIPDAFKVGDLVAFEGYADDFGTPIARVEFTLDGGETWTDFDTAETTTDKWVYWHFEYLTEAPGTYKLDMRAVAADGTVSPLAASMVFTVE